MNAEEPCPACGGSMRLCECMDDPFAPVERQEVLHLPADEFPPLPESNRTQTPLPVDGLCQTCGCGKGGDGDCPCGCTLDSTREAFALGAAWALGDDDEAPAALRAEVKRLSTERDRYRTAWKSAATRAGIAADQAEPLRVRIARAEALIDAWEHDAPDHLEPVFIGRLREVLRRDPAPVRLRGENHA